MMPNNLTGGLLVCSLVFTAVGPAQAQSRSSRMQLPTDYAPDGVLKPWRTSDVACAESGLIDALLITLGDHVQAGTPLARLESSVLETQLEVAQVQAAAKGRRSAVEAEVELNERKVAAFAAARREAYGSQLELERAQADLKIAQAKLQAEVEEQQLLQLQIERLNRQLALRTIVAPIDGVVVEIHKELGEFVAQTSPEVIRLVDVSRLRASFFLQRHEVSRLPPSGRVAVDLGEQGRTTAEVESIAPVADSESGLIEVSVLVDNPGQEVLGSRCTLVFGEAAPEA